MYFSGLVIYISEDHMAASCSKSIFFAQPFLTFGKNIGRVSGAKRKKKEKKCGTHFAQPKALLLPQGVVAYWDSPPLDWRGCHVTNMQLISCLQQFD